MQYITNIVKIFSPPNNTDIIPMNSYETLNDLKTPQGLYSKNTVFI